MKKLMIIATLCLAGVAFAQESAAPKGCACAGECTCAGECMCAGECTCAGECACGKGPCDCPPPPAPAERKD